MVYKWSSRFKPAVTLTGALLRLFLFKHDVVSNNTPYSAGNHEDQAHLLVLVLLERAVSLRTQDLLLVACEAPSF